MVALIEGLPLKPAAADSLLVKLQDASALLGRGNVQGACGKLKDFVAGLTALAGKHFITQNQTDVLIMEATRIQAVLGF